MLPEIWSMTDIIFYHSGPFFALLPHYQPQNLKFQKNDKNAWRYYPFTLLYHKWRSYDVQFLRYKVRQTVFCRSGPFFALWPTPKHSENQNFEKLKKPLGDITILHMCPSNDNHMMYCSWDMECNKQYFILGHFLPFYLTKNLKNKFFSKIEKKQQEMSSFYTCVPQMTIIWYMVPDIWSMTQFFVMADYFLHFHPLTTRENQNFEKMKKTPWDIIILHMCNINENHRAYGSWDMEPNRHYTLSF